MKNDPATERAAAAMECRTAVTLAAWPALRALREKLGHKAKEEKRFRFFSLYGHVWRTDTLEAAWATVRRNGGAPGVDQVRIEDLTATPEREAAFLADLQKELREKTYQAAPVRRVYIPKANGKLRPLGIPTIRDRVVQAAVKLILEPIFEADFEDCSHGFRPGRSAHDALKSIEQSVREGRHAVYDADLEGYFDTIPHDKLIAGVRQRVVDGGVLGLIRQWLNAPVVEPPDKDNDQSGKGPPRVQRQKAGTPQGGVLSPLLANIHLHWFDRAFEGRKGPGQWANARLVRYADDFVIVARHIGPRITDWIEEQIEERLGLRINREKTRTIPDLRADGEKLDFPGFSLKYAHDQYGREGKKYLSLEPSAAACQRQREKVRTMIGPRQSHVPLPDLIGSLNMRLRGWGNYFRLGYHREAFRDMNAYVGLRLTRHLNRRSQRQWKARGDQSAYHHLNQMGLINL